MAVHSKDYLRELACTQDQMLLIHVLEALEEQNKLLRKLAGVEEKPTSTGEVKGTEEKQSTPAPSQKQTRQRKDVVNEQKSGN